MRMKVCIGRNTGKRFNDGKDVRK
jgi:hypothetical protein